MVEVRFRSRAQAGVRLGFPGLRGVDGTGAESRHEVIGLLLQQLLVFIPPFLLDLHQDESDRLALPVGVSAGDNADLTPHVGAATRGIAIGEARVGHIDFIGFHRDVARLLGLVEPLGSAEHPVKVVAGDVRNGQLLARH